MPIPTMNSVAARLTGELLTRGIPLDDDRYVDASADSAQGEDASATEPGFEIAQSMGIALLGLVVAAAFATALETLGVDIISRIRTEIGL